MVKRRWQGACLVALDSAATVSLGGSRFLEGPALVLCAQNSSGVGAASNATFSAWQRWRSWGKLYRSGY